MSKVVIVFFLVVLLSIALTLVYLRQFADVIANVVGYLISLSVVPALIGVFVGGVAYFFAKSRLGKSIGSALVFPISGAVASMCVVAFVLWRLST